MSGHKNPGSTASLNEHLNADTQGAQVEIADAEQQQDPLAGLSPDVLRKRVVEAEEKATQLWERMLRLQAEMDNLQRRAERDVANAHKYALEKFVLELLPIVDGLERAIIAHKDEASGSDTLFDGVQMTLQMLVAAVTKFNVEQINPELQPFNPELHQAVSAQTDANVKPNTVLSVLQKGYLLNNRLIRPALVVVSKSS